MLLDELAGLLDGTATYVHVVVDEAQDLSAMQCRAVARRCPLGSVTVLGDLAQATTPWAPGDWAGTLRHLGHPGAQVRAADRRLPRARRGARRGQPAAAAHRRRTCRRPRRSAPAPTRCASARLELVDGGARAACAAEGSIGVIVADARAGAVLAELRRGRASRPRTLDDEDADPRVAVVPASAAKGLEFDSVVLLEPAEIVAAEPTRPAGCAGSTSCSPGRCPGWSSCTTSRCPRS